MHMFTLQPNGGDHPVNQSQNSSVPVRRRRDLTNLSRVLWGGVQSVAGYTIPAGHQVCVSPTVNQRLPDTWTERDQFSPDRFLGENAASGEKFAYVPFGAGEDPTAV